MNHINQLLEKIQDSPSVFHVIESIIAQLKENNFQQLSENAPFKIQKGQKYYITRNDSSIIAFVVGDKLDSPSFNIVATHSDSPTYKVKPIADIIHDKYSKLNVEPYGGMLCATWFDRPLSVAGRVFIKDGEQIKKVSLVFDQDLFIIPSVAIHLNREANEGTKYNQAIDMIPLFGKATEDKQAFHSLLAKKIQCEKEDILGYDLFLYNRQQGYIWGAENEYISSPRLDDLQCAFASLTAFLNSHNENTINLYCCFDNEEVGSATRQGADSNFLKDTIDRISNALKLTPEQVYQALSSSFMISADNAHAVHPNHPELSDALNRVYMNEGIVIKYNAAQSYTSDGMSAAIFKSFCDKANVRYQQYTNRADLKGGGTLGNISTAHVSILSVDIGLAQLAMHSALETAGSKDSEDLIKVLSEFYNTSLVLDNDKILFKK